MATQVFDDDELESPAASVLGRLIPIIAGNSTAACHDLTLDEHTVGRIKAESDAKPWLVIDSPRISSLHAKFVRKDGDLILEDHSTNGTWVNGDRLGKGKERALKTGDTIAFIKPGCKEASDATASGEHHLFTFIASQPSEQSQGSNASSSTAAASSSASAGAAAGSSSEGAAGSSGEDAALLTCSICQEVLHKAVALQPCLHNLCGGCASIWLKKKPECPECRMKVKVVARNHTLIALVEAFLKRNPERQRPAAELASLDEEDAVGSEPWELKGKKRARDDDDDGDDLSEDDGDSDDGGEEGESGEDDESGEEGSDEGSDYNSDYDGVAEDSDNHPPTLQEQHVFLDIAKAQNFALVRQQVRANHALVNVRPSGRWTALHQAALAGDINTAQFLLDRGADTSLLNRNGQTAQQVAEQHAKMQFVRFIHGYCG